MRRESFTSSKVQQLAGGSRQVWRARPPLHQPCPPSLPAGRHVFSLVSGFLLIYYPFGNGTFHAIIPSLAVYVCMRRFRRSSGTLAWLIAFPYLILACVGRQQFLWGAFLAGSGARQLAAPACRGNTSTRRQRLTAGVPDCSPAHSGAPEG